MADRSKQADKSVARRLVLVEQMDPSLRRERLVGRSCWEHIRVADSAARPAERPGSRWVDLAWPDSPPRQARPAEVLKVAELAEERAEPVPRLVGLPRVPD